MKNIFRKYIKITAVLLLVFSLFIGCKPDSSTIGGATENNGMASDSKQATLTFYFLGSPRQNKHTRRMLDEVEKRVKNTLNIKLIFKWGPITSDFMKFSASGEACDAVGNPGGQYGISDFASKGYLLDITKLFPEHAPKLYNKLSKEDLEGVSYDGKIVAIPNNMPCSSRLCAVVWGDLMKKYNIPDIKTFDDYEVYLKTIKEKEPDLIPGQFEFVPQSALTSFVESYGYISYTGTLFFRWDDPKMELIPIEQIPEFRECVDMMRRWYSNGYIQGINGKARSSIIQHMYYLSKMDISRYIGYKDKPKVYPLNLDKPAAKYDISLNSIMFSRNSANPEKAIAFIQWVESDQENYDLLMNGVKGIDYGLTDNANGSYEKQFPYLWEGSEAFYNMDYTKLFSYDTVNTIEQCKYFLTHNTRNFSSYNLQIDKLSFSTSEEKTARDIESKRNSEFGIFAQSIASGNGKYTIEAFVQKQEDLGAQAYVKMLQKQINKLISNSK